MFSLINWNKYGFQLYFVGLTEHCHCVGWQQGGFVEHSCCGVRWGEAICWGEWLVVHGNLCEDGHECQWYFLGNW